jgi:Radial spoke protein 3.
VFQILNRPPESDASCQTDLFLDRPDSPVYVPTTIGLDVETQIYAGDVSFNRAINLGKANIEITRLRIFNTYFY